MTRFLLLFSVAFLALYSSRSEAATYAQAMASCQLEISNGLPGFSTKWKLPASCTVSGQNVQLFGTRKGTDPLWQFLQNYGFTGPLPPDLDCSAGALVSPGTPYKKSSSTGEACTTVGSSSCEMSMVVGGPSSGSQILTGGACLATDQVDDGLVPETPSETVNVDGGKTYCDPISGKCVTASPQATQAPASSSSSANSSTDTTSTTDHPASSSSSTTTSTSTTTTTGDGSGSGTGSGNSTGVTTGTSTTHTDAPASSSSTASKCTGGACDVGNADGIMGQMYTAGTDTPASVYADFKAAVSASPLMSSASGFFDASGIAGGTCPTWHIPGNRYWGEAGFSFDFFCSPGMLQLLALAGLMVLAVGAFSAFRIAIY